MRILHVRPEDKATSTQRHLALQNLGHELENVYTFRLKDKPSSARRFLRKLQFMLGYFPERNNENENILSLLDKTPCDIIFIEKGLSIRRETLIRLKSRWNECKTVSYVIDDIGNRSNRSVQYLNALTMYDLHVTTKAYNVNELKELGASRVLHVHNAYSSDVHRPVTITEDERERYGADVTFIGTGEKQREELLIALASKGYQIKIWGWGGRKSKKLRAYTNVTLHDKHVYGDDYAKVISASKINLCFLRKVNRDEETTRSVEIPACGGFMLAEDSIAHRELFLNNIEAVFFQNESDLLEKVEYYLYHPEERESVAIAGRQRCLSSDYSYESQLETILNSALE